jgi:tetratricopeptide (TPR) repeat protein
MRRLNAATVLGPVLACLLLLILIASEAAAQKTSPSNEQRVSTSTFDVESAFAEATRLHQAGDLDGAIRGYQAILARYPNRGDVRSNLGAAYARLGRYEEAIDQYRQALKLNPGNQTIRYNLALAYYKAAWFTEAANELTSLVASMPADAAERQSTIFILADSRVRLGEYRKAIDLLSPLEPVYGNDRAFAYLLGSALISDDQVARGQVLIDRVFRGNDSAEAHMLIGSILLLADDKHGAIKEFERALQLNPKLPGLQSCYGRAHMRLGDGEEAMKAFKKELADNPNDFDANLYLGIILKRDKMLDESYEYLSRAARLRPRDAYSRYHLGALFAAQGKPAEAIRLLEAVEKEYPDFIEAHVLLASVYYRLNRKADADREQQIVKKLNAEQQAKQPGVEAGVLNNPGHPSGQASGQASEQTGRSKPPTDPPDSHR